MANYLADRDDVFVTEPKEPHFFATDFPGYRSVTSLHEYEQLFSSAGDESVVGEASVFYLYSEVALVNIAQFNPDAKIIVMLRNPVDLVHSLHGQLLFSHDENVIDFSEAWQLNERRRNGDQIPPRCRDPKLLEFDKVAMLGGQLHRLYQFFPRQNVLVILFQDFVSDIEGEFCRAVEFLGLENQGRTDFPRINESRRHRSRVLANLLFNHTGWMRRPVKTNQVIFRVAAYRSN